MPEYLLQTVLFQLVFLLVFELLLKKETFFSYNRWYLLLTPIVSLLLPLFSFESLTQIIPEGTFVYLPGVILGEGTTSGDAETFLASGISDNHSWLSVYFLGVLCSLFFFVKKYRALRQLFRNRVISEEEGVKIIELPHSNLACSFHKTIFLGNQLSTEERKQILAHEKIHVHQRHSLDLLYFEILKILFWFNPLIYVYQVKLAALHEYLADEGVVKMGEKKTYYEQLLNTAFNTENISFINQFFNQSLIKKRIVMLQRSKSKSIAKTKFLILLPVMFCMLTFVSFAQETGNETQQAQEPFSKIMVADVEDQTAEEKVEVQAALKKLTQEKAAKMLVVTDGGSSIVYELEYEAGVAVVTKTEKLLSVQEVPFELIEEGPVFPGCESQLTAEEKKKCMVEKVTRHVNTNFNLGLANKTSLEGVQKIYVQFKIDKSGSVSEVKARAAAPELEEEATRVVEMLPRMTPGKHKGEPVSVLYMLPIQLNLKADKAKEEQ